MTRMKKFGLIIGLFTFLPCQLMAQEELYIQNDDVVALLSKKAAQSRAKKDQVKQDIYVDAIKAAFHEYWTTTDCKSSITADSLDRVELAIKQLKENKTELTTSIKNLQAQAKENKKFSQKLDQINQKRSEAVKLKHDIDSIDGLIAQLDEEARKIEPKLKKIEKAEGTMESKREDVRKIEKELKEIKDLCEDASLLDANVKKKALGAIQSFREKRRLMQNISEDTERKASERADYINRYISLSDALQKGIVQMGNSFSAKQNQEIIVSISGLMSQMGELSDVQKKECNEVVASLREQEKTYTALISFLDSIVNNNGVISDEDMRADVKNDIEKELKKENSSLKFCKYYTKFQVVLNQLISDMTKNSPTLSLNTTKTEEGLKRYINSLKNKL